MSAATFTHQLTLRCTVFSSSHDHLSLQDMMRGSVRSEQVSSEQYRPDLLQPDSPVSPVITSNQHTDIIIILS